MSLLLTVLALLALVTVAGTLSRLVPAVPLPLLQLGLGIAFGWPAEGLHLTLDPQVFMLLFIPPLLFNDGWRISKRELGAQSLPVLLLAVGLVLITVVVVGHVVAWMFPGMPMAVAYLLAAVLSPTDALAVGAIARRQRMPVRMLSILEGESLMNDATALVAVKVALVAALTQHFSPGEAAVDLVWMGAGGVAVGVLCSAVFHMLQALVLRGREHDVDMPGVLLLLLIPFPPYLLAEHWGLSGVLAAVAAGMSASMLALRRSGFNASHVQTASTSGVVRYVLDGLVFLVLGLQLSEIVRAMPEQVNLFNWPPSALAVQIWSAGLGVAVLLLALRFAAFYVAGRLRHKVQWLKRRSSTRPFTPALAAVGALGGVRGAITLVAVMGVPLTLVGGEPFPLRGLLVFLSGLVILLTMVIAAVALPPLLRHVARTQGERGVDLSREHQWARRRSARAALRVLTDAACWHGAPVPAGEPQGAVRATVSASIGHAYRQRLAVDAPNSAESHDAPAAESAQHTLALERHLRLALLQAEREELRRLRLRNRINDETLRALTHEIDLVEAALRHRA